MSEIITDTITGKSTATTITIGSTPVVSSSANSMTIRGEGTAQTSIQQGLAKSWAYLNGQGTIALQDSFNNSSATDHGTGEYTFNFTSNMGNAFYSSKFSGISQTNTGANGTTTSSIRVRVRDGSDTNYDSQQVMTGIHGDLA